jgi:anaerobic ribonucleoside-triphosphate reductase activating protein
MLTGNFLMKKKALRFQSQIKVGGLTPLTTIDYPGELAAVVFLQGCPWRCGYCQNSDLIPRNNKDAIPWKNVITLLEKRQGLLDAVVFSGGEPTLHSGLAQAMRQVKSLGYKIGLHTAGIYPRRLRKLLPLVDWVGMDIKSAKEDYPSVTGVRGSGEHPWKSAQLIIESGVAHEFRTTVHPDMLGKEQLTKLVNELTELGAEHYVIQECTIGKCLDETRQITTAAKIDKRFLEKFRSRFPDFLIRPS